MSAPAVAAAFSKSWSPVSVGDRRVAMIPEPTTAMIRKHDPTASAVSRRPKCWWSLTMILGCSVGALDRSSIYCTQAVDLEAEVCLPILRVSSAIVPTMGWFRADTEGQVPRVSKRGPVTKLQGIIGSTGRNLRSSKRRATLAGQVLSWNFAGIDMLPERSLADLFPGIEDVACGATAANRHHFEMPYAERFVLDVLTEPGARIVQHREDTTTFNFSEFEGKADLVLIDASHVEADVLRDSHTAPRLLSERGVIVWDDYHAGQLGVVRAINEFAQTHEVCHIRWTRLAASVRR